MERSTKTWLDYWAKNITKVQGLGLNWPGFRYSAEEWHQLRTLAEGVSNREYTIFLILNTLLFISCTGMGVVFILLPLLSTIYPDPSRTSAAVFLSCLGLFAVLSASLGLIYTMSLVAFLLRRFYPPDPLIALPAAQRNALSKKIRRQFLRILLPLTVVALSVAGIDLCTGNSIEHVFLPYLKLVGTVIILLTTFYIILRPRS